MVGEKRGKGKKERDIRSCYENDDSLFELFCIESKKDKEEEGDENEEQGEKEVVVIKKIVRKGKDVKQEIDIFQKIKKTSLLVPKDFKKIWGELSSLYLEDDISRDDITEKIPIKHLQCIGQMIGLDKLSKYNSSNKEELVDRIIEKMKKKEDARPS